MKILILQILLLTLTGQTPLCAQQVTPSCSVMTDYVHFKSYGKFYGKTVYNDFDCYQTEMTVPGSARVLVVKFMPRLAAKEKEKFLKLHPGSYKVPTEANTYVFLIPKGMSLENAENNLANDYDILGFIYPDSIYVVFKVGLGEGDKEKVYKAVGLPQTEQFSFNQFSKPTAITVSPYENVKEYQRIRIKLKQGISIKEANEILENEPNVLAVYPIYFDLSYIRSFWYE
jgi:hypothetical protein